MHPVIIAGNGPRANIDVSPHRRVSNIREVVYLAAFADSGFLDLAEIADVGLPGQNCSGPQTGKGTDPGGLANFRPVQMRERKNLRIGSNGHIAKHTIGTDLHPVAKRHLSFKEAADIDENIPAA